MSNALLKGQIKSCGCMRKELASKVHTTHGHTRSGKRSLTYGSWEAMRKRCLDSSRKDFKSYGALGVVICSRWSSFCLFVEDMGERPSKKHSIDRVDPDKGYYKENCKWSTSVEQAINCRKRKNTSSYFKGVSFCSKMLHRPWKCTIQKGRNTTHLGYFKTEEEAAKTYNDAALKLHGDYARINPMQVYL